MALITAFIAAAALIAAAWISHSAKISEFRQAWINGLRDDLAMYFRDLEALHFDIERIINNEDQGKADELDRLKRESRNSLLFAYNRILLRLNMNERLHNDLVVNLKEFWNVEQRVPDQAKVEEAIALSQQLLKQEWEVTKRLPLPWQR